jgi:hypothetical protein
MKWGKIYLIIALTALSCAKKESPVIIKEEVKPLPEKFTEATAVKALERAKVSELDNVLSTVLVNSEKNFSWSEFWAKLSWNRDEPEALTKVLELGKFSCSEKASSNFLSFYKKNILNFSSNEKSGMTEKMLNHFLACGLKAPASLLETVLDTQEKVEKKDLDVFAKYISLNDQPSSQNLQRIVDIYFGESNFDFKLNLYKILDGKVAYQAIRSEIIKEGDFLKLLSSSLLKELDVSDFVNLVSENIWKVENLKSENMFKLSSVYDSFSERKNQLFEKKLLLDSEIEFLSKYDQAGVEGIGFLNLVEKFSSRLLSQFNELSPYYSYNSILYQYAAAMSGIEFERERVGANRLEKMLLLRGKVQSESNPEIAHELVKQLCNSIKEYKIDKIEITSESEVKKQGCFNYSIDTPFVITKPISMGLFSVIATNGQSIDLRNNNSVLSVLDLTQTNKRVTLATPVTEQKFDSLVLPLVIGIRPLKATQKYKKDSTYYLSLYHIYRDGRDLVPTLENVEMPRNGFSGGNLILNQKEEVSWMKFISLGGEGQQAAPGKRGGLGFVDSFELFPLQKWIRSFSGNNSFYFSDSKKNKRNLEELINSAIDDDNQINVFVDPNYLTILNENQREKILNAVSEVSELEGLDNASIETVLSMLARRSLRKLLETLQAASYGDELQLLLPELFSELEISSGPVGERYPNAKRGENGKIVYR